MTLTFQLLTRLQECPIQGLTPPPLDVSDNIVNPVPDYNDTTLPATTDTTDDEHSANTDTNLAEPENTIITNETVDNEIASPRQSNRFHNPVKIYEPSFTGKKYATSAITVGHSFATIHPNAHMLDNYGVDWDHVMHVTMTQLSMKAGMKRWGR